MSLRDELLKAGLISQQQAQSADQLAQAKSRQQRSGPAQKAPKPEPAARVLSEAERAEVLSKVDGLMEEHGTKVERGGRRWYFLMRDGRVRHYDVSDRQAQELEGGKLGIVEGSAFRTAVVLGKGVPAIQELDGTAVRLWNR